MTSRWSATIRRGKMKKLYKGENPLLYTAEYHPEDETKEQMLARDPLAGTGKIVSPTPDRITKLGIARTFQNIRLWKSMTVFENVLVAKHMRRQAATCSPRPSVGNAKEEARMRDETHGPARRAVGLDEIQGRHCDDACPTASSAGWRSPARWRRIRSCCCSTSRRPA